MSTPMACMTKHHSHGSPFDFVTIMFSEATDNSGTFDAKAGDDEVSGTYSVATQDTALGERSVISLVITEDGEEDVFSFVALVAEDDMWVIWDVDTNDIHMMTSSEERMEWWKEWVAKLTGHQPPMEEDEELAEYFMMGTTVSIDTEDGFDIGEFGDGVMDHYDSDNNLLDTLEVWFDAHTRSVKFSDETSFQVFELHHDFAVGAYSAPDEMFVELTAMLKMNVHDDDFMLEPMTLSDVAGKSLFFVDSIELDLVAHGEEYDDEYGDADADEFDYDYGDDPSSEDYLEDDMDEGDGTTDDVADEDSMPDESVGMDDEVTSDDYMNEDEGE